MTTQERKAQLAKMLKDEGAALEKRHKIVVATRAAYDESIGKIEALKKETANASEIAKDALSDYQNALEQHSQSLQVINKLKGEMMRVAGSETGGVPANLPA